MSESLTNGILEWIKGAVTIGVFFAIGTTGIWLRKYLKSYVAQISFNKFMNEHKLTISANRKSNFRKNNLRLFLLAFSYLLLTISIYWYYKNDQITASLTTAAFMFLIVLGYFGHRFIPKIPILGDIYEAIKEMPQIGSNDKPEMVLLDNYLKSNLEDRLRYKQELIKYGPNLVDVIINHFIKVASPYKSRIPKRENIETIDTSNLIVVGNPFFLELEKIRSNFHQEKKLLAELISELIMQSDEVRYLVAWRFAKAFNRKLSRGWAIAIILYEIAEHDMRLLRPNPNIFFGKKYIGYMTKINKLDERNTWKLFHELTLAITNYNYSQDPSNVEDANFMWKREMGIWIMIKSTGYFLLSL